MGKKKDNLRNCFSESIDPRFSGIFNSIEATSNNKTTEKSTDCFTKNKKTEPNNPKVKEIAGFQNYISNKLTQFLDSEIKEVDRMVAEPEFFSNKPKTIQLFSDSDVIMEEQIVESVSKKPKKKKRKKDREDKESFKEVAVSFDWLQRQSQLLNS